MPQGLMMRLTSGKWRVVASALGGALSLLMLGLSGCSSAATAAQSAATAAAANVYAAATQPSTVNTVTSTVTSTQSAAKAILGRWVQKGAVLNTDGSIGTETIGEIVFNQNGSFLNLSRAGAMTGYKSGKFQVLGSVITFHIGNVQQVYHYRINGAQLLLINSTTHQAVQFQRG